MIGKLNNLEPKKITHPDAALSQIRALVSPKEGWEGYVLRVIDVEPNGYTPAHQHLWPHINYILEGEGSLLIDGVWTDVEKDSYAYVPENAFHQFKNRGNTNFRFICIVPEIGHQG